MTRIHYFKTDSGLQSQVLFATDKLVYIQICDETNTITIRQSPKGTIEWQCEAPSEARAKVLAKRMLKRMGVNFNDEVRYRK